MSAPREVRDAKGNLVHRRDQPTFKCNGCKYRGPAEDLELPKDDTESLKCPQCGTAAWEWI